MMLRKVWSVSDSVCLVVFFSEATPNRVIFQRIVNGLWRCQAPVHVLEDDRGLLQFLFFDAGDRE
ncbi:unnamed protein product, partial [Linum tenue]